MSVTAPSRPDAAELTLPRWLRPFGRVTSGRALLPEVDGLRFIAIFAVVLFHMHGALLASHSPDGAADPISQAVNHVIRRGNFGVPLFFAISGFILMLPFARAAAGACGPVNLGSYFLRRVTRLEPPYILNLVVCFALEVRHAGDHLGELIQHLLASIGYVHNLVYGQASTINEVAWSLEIEVQFYCLAPVLALLYRLPPGIRWTVIATLAAAGCALSLTPLSNLRSLATHIQYFLAGMWCAERHIVAREPASGRLGFDLVFLAAMAIPLLLAPPSTRAVWAWVAPFSVLGMLTGALWSRGVRRILRHPLVFTIGGMCYTIYLWHGLVWSFAWHRLQALGRQWEYWQYFCLQAALVLPVVAAGCAVLFALFERPFMRRDWPQRLLHFLRGSTQANQS